MKLQDFRQKILQAGILGIAEKLGRGALFQNLWVLHDMVSVSFMY